MRQVHSSVFNKVPRSTTSSICSRSVDKSLLPLETRWVFLTSRGELIWQPSPHKEQSCASLLFNLLANMSFSTTSFHIFFGLPSYEPLTAKVFAFTGAFLHPSFPYTQTISIAALYPELFCVLHISHKTNCYSMPSLRMFFDQSHVTFSFSS